MALAKEKWPALQVRVVPIRNDFFGETITVSGLVTGGDLIKQLSGLPIEKLVLPANMLRQEEMDFLDDVTLEEAERELGVKIYPISQDGGELCDAMLGVLPEVKKPLADAEDTEYNKYNQ